MKITNAWVDDPTYDGELRQPILCVEVDELPDVTIAPEEFAGGWRVGKYGPFVKYALTDPDVPILLPADAGDFNIRFRHRFPVVADIQLFLKNDDSAVSDEYSLPLRRARQLIRKYDSAWRLLVNERAAEKGSLVWTPVQTDPSCRYMLPVDVCGVRPAKPIYIGDVRLPLCEQHLKMHNRDVARRRIAKTS